MNREIQFRGKSEEGKWIYGDLLRIVLGGNIHYYIKPLDGKREEVNLKTIGQFTGLKDCKRIAIFEGDIIEEQISGIKRVVVYSKSGKWALQREGFDNYISLLPEVEGSFVVGDVWGKSAKEK